MTSQEQPQQDPSRERSIRSNAFLRYGSMATQMAATIAIAVWGGIKLDQSSGGNSKTWTLILSLTGVIVAMYAAIKDLIRKKQ
jgi:hypothetical protein